MRPRVVDLKGVRGEASKCSRTKRTTKRSEGRSNMITIHYGGYYALFESAKEANRWLKQAMQDALDALDAPDESDYIEHNIEVYPIIPTGHGTRKETTP